MRGGGRREKKREMETGKPGERDSGTLTSCAGFNTQSLLWVRPPTRDVDIEINRTLLLSSGTSESVLGDNKKNG